MDFSLLFLMSGPSLEHCFSRQNRFLIRHRVTFTPVSCTFFLTFHLTQMCVHVKPQHEMGSEPSAGFLELFLDTDSNRKKYPFPRRDRAVNSHSVCYALYPEMSIPPLSRASFPPLSLSCSHSSGACSISFWFWTSLMSNALRYSCPSVSSVLLASGFCLLFWLFCNLWGWAVTGKRQISALPSWTGVMNNCFL